MGAGLFTLLVLLCAAAVVVASSVAIRRLGLWLARRSDEAYWASMKRRGRLIEWSEALERCTAGAGTLLVEADIMKGPVRCYWAPSDNVPERHLPLRDVSDERFPQRGSSEAEEEARLAREVHARIADVTTGSGLAVRLPPESAGDEWAASWALPTSTPILTILMFRDRPLALARGDFWAWLYSTGPAD